MKKQNQITLSQALTSAQGNITAFARAFAKNNTAPEFNSGTKLTQLQRLQNRAIAFVQDGVIQTAEYNVQGSKTDTIAVRTGSVPVVKDGKAVLESTFEKVKEIDLTLPQTTAWLRENDGLTEAIKNHLASSRISMSGAQARRLFHKDHEVSMNVTASDADNSVVRMTIKEDHKAIEASKASKKAKK